MTKSKTPTFKKVKPEPRLYDVKQDNKTNRTTYIVRRLIQYDPETKKQITLDSYHVGYINEVTGEWIYNEGYEPLPKKERKSKKASTKAASQITEAADKAQAVEECAELQAIEERAGSPIIYPSVVKEPTLYNHVIESLVNVTPIGEAIIRSCPKDLKNIVISLLEYNLTCSEAIRNIESHQNFKQFTYKHKLNVSTTYDALQRIGSKASITQTVFETLSQSVTKGTYVVIDSTSFKSYSKNNMYATHGRNSKDGTKEFKLQMIYSVERGYPIGFKNQEGNIPDVISLGNMVDTCKSMGMTDVKFLIDRGYGSQANYSELLEAGIDFTSPINLNMTWVKKEFTSPVGEFANIAEAFETASFLILSDTPSELALTFEDGLIGVRKECTVQFSQCTREHTLWLYFYKNLENAAKEEAEYLEKLKDLPSKIKKGTMLYKDLTKEEITNLSKIYDISETEDGFVRISPNKEKMEYQNSTYGVHVIMSTEKKEPREIKEIYNARSEIESCFRILKTDMDSDTARVWTQESIAGLELCRLLAVGCKLSLQKVLNNIKARCREVSEDTQQKVKDREAHKHVLKWINKAGSLRRVLEELMLVKKTTIQTLDGVVEITDATTARTKLFMELFDQEFARLFSDYKE